MQRAVVRLGGFVRRLLRRRLDRVLGLRFRFAQRVEVGEDVVPGNAPVPAGAAHLGDVDAVLLGDAAHEGRDDGRAVLSERRFVVGLFVRRRGRGRGRRGLSERRGSLGFRRRRGGLRFRERHVGAPCPALAGAGRPDGAHVLEELADARAALRLAVERRLEFGLRGRFGAGPGPEFQPGLGLLDEELADAVAALRLAVNGRLRLIGGVEGGVALDLDLGDGVPHRDGVALVGDDAREGAGVGGGHLHAHLVGGDLDDGVVLLDALADADEPLADDAFGYGFADLGELDDDWHNGAIVARGRAAPNGFWRRVAPRSPFEFPQGEREKGRAPIPSFPRKRESRFDLLRASTPGGRGGRRRSCRRWA